jgi:hypothetical protein
VRSGDVRAYAPASFIDSCATLGLPNPVRQQNDASEFCDMLLGSIERLFKGRIEQRLMQVRAPRIRCLQARSSLLARLLLIVAAHHWWRHFVAQVALVLRECRAGALL